MAWDTGEGIMHGAYIVDVETKEQVWLGDASLDIVHQIRDYPLWIMLSRYTDETWRAVLERMCVEQAEIEVESCKAHDLGYGTIEHIFSHADGAAEYITLILVRVRRTVRRNEQASVSDGRLADVTPNKVYRRIDGLRGWDAVWHLEAEHVSDNREDRIAKVLNTRRSIIGLSASLSS